MLYFPVHLNVETSDLCNRSCDFCPIQHQRPRSEPLRPLDLGIFRRLLLELRDAPWPVKISLQWIDEPLANPNFFAYADLGRDLLPEATWLLQTNGDLLTPERAGDLRRRFDAVAINLYSANAAARLRRLELDVVWARHSDRLQSPGRLRRPPGGGDRIRDAVFHLNHKYHESSWIQRFTPAQLPADAPCTRPWTQAAVGYDGQVYLCCRDNFKAHPVGSLRERSLFECYNGEVAQRLRDLMRAGQRDRIAMCHICPNRFVEGIQVVEPAGSTALEPHACGDGVQTRVEEIVAQRAARAQRKRAHGGRAAVVPTLDRRRKRARGVERQLPWGHYDYLSARSLARSLGHVALPGFLPRRYEVVVGLTPTLAQTLVGVVRERLGTALKGLWVCGSRVMTRPRLLLVDPFVFECEGPLRIGGKDRLRELGWDPRYSSDLDLKILVDAQQVSLRAARGLGRRLGHILERASPHFPISGHRDPQHQLIRVPTEIDGARAAFAWYNGQRFARTGKGPLSLEYTQLLLDPSELEEEEVDATAPVRQQLEPRAGSALAPIDEISTGEAFAVLDGGERLRAHHQGLSGHQLVCALLDFPDLEPRGVVVDGQGRVREGSLAVWAAGAAGRSQVAVHRGG